MGRKSFSIHADYYIEIENLDHTQRSNLFLALIMWASDRAHPVLDSECSMLFRLMTAQIERISKANTGRGGAPTGNQNARKTTETTETTLPLPLPLPKPKPITVSSKDESTAKAVTRVQCQDVIDLFNKTCTSLPKVQRLTDKRTKILKTRLIKYTRNDFEHLFTLAENSDFLSGRKKDFRATFDWLIEEANLVKVLEGNYDNQKSKSNTQDFSDTEKYQNLTMD